MNRRPRSIPIRPGWLTASLLIAAAATAATAGEVRLYRIVGGDLELYNRVECDVDRYSMVDLTLLREMGLFDIHSEDMVDDARRPRSRGDGLLWDAPRSRWIGFLSEEDNSLVALNAGGEGNTFEELHRFEPIRPSYSSLWPTDDPNVYYVTLDDMDMFELPTVVRLEFGNGVAPVSVETWDMSNRDPELMREVYGTPVPQHETRDCYWTAVRRDGRLFTLTSTITEWEFGVLPPVRVWDHTEVMQGYGQFDFAPDGELFAASSTSGECQIDVWRTNDDTPIVSFPLQEPGWLNGGYVAFTPDGKYLWYDSAFVYDLRVWRCEDWVELDAFRLAGKRGFAFIHNHSAEWIVAERETPFEDEPTEWLERGPYEPATPSSASSDVCISIDVVGLIADTLGTWLKETRERRQARFERRRHIRQLPRRPEWDEG